MNIGIVTTWFERGAAYVSKAYLRALEQQHKVFVYARGGEAYALGDPEWDRPNVTWGRRLRGVGPNSTAIHLRDFRRWIETNAIDTILFNEQTVWQPILAARKLGVLVGAYVDNYTRETVPFFRLYDYLLCNTKRHHSVFADHPQALYIPWGTDPALFRPDPGPVREGVVTFFHSVGMSPYRKGSDLAIEAFLELSGPARLVLHSQVPAEQIPRVGERVSADPRIEFHHETVGLPGLYHRGDVYVYPARKDGIGLTMPEAGAAGLPIIAPDAGPMNEFVVDGVNGRLLPVDHWDQRRYYWPDCHVRPEAVRAAMQWYLDHADELPARKQAARRYAEEHFDWARHAAVLGARLAQLRPVAVDAALVRAVTRFDRYWQCRDFVHERLQGSGLRPVMSALRAGRRRPAALSP
jgi:glycosyltransferase involved in cell wall biosynthesis